MGRPGERGDMGLLGVAKEKARNLHFFDDGSFIFRELEIEKGWLIENNAQGKGIRAFMLPYKLQKHFFGYKSIGSGKVLMTYSRDVVWDPYGQLPNGDKPEKGKGLKEKMMSSIASSTVYQHAVDARPSSLADKMILFCGSVAVLLALSIGAQVAFGGG